MATPCTPMPANRKEYISEIGKILVKTNGKKKFYKPEQVKNAHRKSKWYTGIDFSCWAMSTYSSHSEFDAYHANTDDVCDYVGMKTEVLNELSTSPMTNWSDIPHLEIDSSWLEFDNVFEGIGEFIEGILDGL